MGSYKYGVIRMKSNLMTKLFASLLAVTAFGSSLGMGGFYEPDPKVVTTEEKINHYLFYLVNHGLASTMQSGLNKAIPDLVERVAVDGARMMIPEMLGVKTPNQKRLVYWGIDGVRQAVRYGQMVKEKAQKEGVVIKKSEGIKYFLTKQFIPAFVRNLVVDLMYQSGSLLAEPMLARIGMDQKNLASNPYSMSAMIYEQVRGSAYPLCYALYDRLFARKS